MLEYLVLGAIQGIFEWLPVSSEGLITLASLQMGITNPIQLALYLHLGTVLAVLVYFRKDLKKMLAHRDKKLLRFLAVATIVSLPVGLIIYKVLNQISFGSPVWYLVVGLGLIVTGILINKKKSGLKSIKKTTDQDALIAGTLQGFAIIPGVSRSGITLFALLSSEYTPEAALTLSFLMSVPVVLAANAFLVLEGVSFVPTQIFAIIPSFLFGLATMKLLLSVSKKANFSMVAFLFGAISIIAYLIA